MELIGKKFRVWDKDCDTMHYTDEDLVVGFSDNGVDVTDHTTFGSSFMDIDNFELMQSTGFKDNNDTDIYIGDILEWEAIMGFGWYDKTIDNVIYDENELKIKMNKRDDYSLNRVVAVGCEVIGNIYEHSYLLEE